MGRDGRFAARTLCGSVEIQFIRPPVIVASAIAAAAAPYPRTNPRLLRPSGLRSRLSEDTEETKDCSGGRVRSIRDVYQQAEDTQERLHNAQSDRLLASAVTRCRSRAVFSNAARHARLPRPWRKPGTNHPLNAFTERNHGA